MRKTNVTNLLDGFAVVVPWVSNAQLASFLDAWGILTRPNWLVLQHDAAREGCAVTKNLGIAEALRRGAEGVVVLDDDCYPTEEAPDFRTLVKLHVKALQPQDAPLFEVVTDPPSRGTPYNNLTVKMPVAASMGFWTNVGDYCATRQLALGARPMEFRRVVVHGRYFPLCGMNVAFRPREWDPWCRFIDVPRFDDIWMGWLWQKEAYRRGFCFNLAGPLVHHSRQSDPWKNFAVEAKHLARNEMLWADIATATDASYEKLLQLLPSDPGGSDR